MKEKWETIKAWCKENPLMAGLIGAAVLLAILQVFRVAGQYQDLKRTVDALMAASAAA